jgi:hypothetical protein
VGTLLAEASGLTLPAGLDWEFLVIDDEEVNAFVLPNCGKVFVHRGLIGTRLTRSPLALSSNLSPSPSSPSPAPTSPDSPISLRHRQPPHHTTLPLQTY